MSDQDKSGTFWNKVQLAAEAAPQAGYPSFSYGKLTARPMVAVWVDSDEVDPETGKVKRKKISTPYQDGHVMDPDKETLEIEFEVDIQEFNPDLQFKYLRTVSMLVSGPKKLTDWSEIVLPSLLKVFGAAWAQFLDAGVYVKIEDVTSVSGGVSKKGNPYSTIKFVEKYANKALCQAAHTAQYAKRDSATGETVATVTDNIPEAAIVQVKGLLASMGDSAEKVTPLIQASEGLKEYDTARLIELARAHA